MHHALHIEEILLHIFSYCHTWPPRPRKWQSCYANVHLATLARTCRAFNEPALDMMWAELNDLTPLVRCLPNESWLTCEPVEPGVVLLYTLKKRLEQTDWDIILGYTRRVRALPRLSASSRLAADCIEALSRPPVPTVSIFPNLRIVGLDEPSATITPLVPHLINPKVTDITFERTETLGSAINAFGGGCPSVTDFRVSQWALSDTILGLIRHWRNLSSIHCYNVGLNIDALSHLSCLRNLLHLSFKVHDALVDQIQAAHPSPSMLTFSALHDLYLGSPFLTPIWRLLHHFHVPMLHVLSVCLHARPTAPDLRAFFVALPEACTPTSLNKLLLRAYDNGDKSVILSVENITFDRLRPLTAFVNIKSITLDIPCSVDLSERELLRLASSWPQLERFEVGRDHDWTPSSAITPGGFLQLLERCRSLRVLFVMFDTRGYTEIPQGHPWRGLRMPKHAFIHLLNSPIEKESIEALGVFFHVAPYPDFNLTTHWNNRYFRGSERPRELCDLYYYRWVEARDRARDLWEKRMNLRRSLEVGYSQRYS